MSQWISVEDRLPELLQKVLFFWVKDDQVRNIAMGFRNKLGWRIYLPYTSYEVTTEYIRVTHWMELPEYPKC
jgi:hypothetical protein